MTKAAEKMQCANCKYWGDEDEDYRALYETKRCRKAIQLWNAGDFRWDEELEERVYDLNPKHADQLMFVADGSDYRADLFTKADFFCAHFEQKDGGA